MAIASPVVSSAIAWCATTSSIAALEPLTKNEKLTGPVYAALWFFIGDSRFHLKKWAESITALEKFLAAQPKHANVDTALFRLGLAYQQRGLQQLARRAGAGGKCVRA